jgi:hypothetical protein
LFYDLRVWNAQSQARYKADRYDGNWMQIRFEATPLRASENETGFSQILSSDFFENLTIYKIPLYLLWGESGTPAGHTWSIQPCPSQGLAL